MVLKFFCSKGVKHQLYWDVSLTIGDFFKLYMIIRMRYLSTKNVPEYQLVTCTKASLVIAVLL